ncbi:MAG: PilN domain-containing protein [Terriglobales bacterium]
MIRINLLGVTKQPKAPSVPATAGRQAVIFVVSAVIAFGIVGVIYRIWSNQIAELDKKIAAAKIEADRLAQIRAENQRYVAQRVQLERRINTIQALLNAKAGPVDFMTYLGNVATHNNDLYLLTVTPEGARVVIKGQANTVESIATFIANLQASGRFQEVQLRQYYQDDQNERLSFKFNIDCVYKMPLPEPSAAQGQPGAGQATPARQAGF